METWSELSINDYILVDNELIRIWALPKNPDDDCTFYSVAGQRQGFLETTPTHHSMGTSMYKVAIHPPGTSFPPIVATGAIIGFALEKNSYCKREGWSCCIHCATGEFMRLRTIGCANVR